MWFKIEDHHVRLSILAKPNAKQTKLIAMDDKALHIAVHAKPHKGEANQALIAYLAKLLKTPKTQLTLQRGEASKHKVILAPFNETIQYFLDHAEEFIKPR